MLALIYSRSLHSMSNNTWIIIPAIVMPTYATAIPYIDRYVLDHIDNQYNWLFLVAATMFSAILAFITDEEHRKLVASIKADLAETKNELIKTRNELQETRNELKAVKDELAKTNRELNTTKDELAKTNRELAKTNKELDAVKTELAETKIEMQRQIDDLSQSNRALQSNVNELSAANATIQAQLNGATEERSTMRRAMDRHEFIINMNESAQSWPYSFINNEDLSNTDE